MNVGLHFSLLLFTELAHSPLPFFVFIWSTSEIKIYINFITYNKYFHISKQIIYCL